MDRANEMCDLVCAHGYCGLRRACAGARRRSAQWAPQLTSSFFRSWLG